MPDNDPTQTQQAPLNPDLAGYPSVEALVQGYRSSGEEAKRLREQVGKYESVLAQVVQNGGVPNGRQNVPDRRATSAQDRLTDFGIPVDALEEVVQQSIQKAFQPLSRGIEARGQIVAKHPGYVQFETDVAQFINTDPDLSQRYPALYAADPYAAMEYALLRFSDSRRRSGGPPEGETRNGVADAQIPGSRAGDGRRAPTADAQVQEAFERFNKTGSSRDAAAYAKARLGPLLKDQFRAMGQEL
jgi:hypothetical protein